MKGGIPMDKMSLKTEKALLDRGFVKNEKGGYDYAMGSIANYQKLFISAPSEQFSLAEDKYVLACYVQYESFSEAGYIEVDWHKKESGYVALNKLIDYVEAKGVKRRKME
jgi:hypothetical protein